MGQGQWPWDGHTRPSHTLRSIDVGGQLCEGNYTPVISFQYIPYLEVLGWGGDSGPQEGKGFQPQDGNSQDRPAPLYGPGVWQQPYIYILPLFETKQMNKYFKVSIRKMDVLASFPEYSELSLVSVSTASLLQGEKPGLTQAGCSWPLAPSTPTTSQPVP